MLKVENVTFAYDKLIVLNDISFTITPGKVLGVIGPNGSGKSTLIKAISHVLTPHSGRILIDKQDVRNIKREELARLVAVVPQNPTLPEAFTAFEVVLMGRTPHLGLFRYESQRDMAIAWQAMRLTQTESLAQRRINQLSGGERQRLTIARALTQEPKVILLDEPTANLDINHQVEILDLVKELCITQGLIALTATHDLNLAAQYCDRLIMLDKGRLNVEGAPRDVITSQKIKEVYGAEVCIYPHPLNGLPTTLIIAGDGKHAGIESELGR